MLSEHYLQVEKVFPANNFCMYYTALGLFCCCALNSIRDSRGSLLFLFRYPRAVAYRWIVDWIILHGLLPKCLYKRKPG